MRQYKGMNRKIIFLDCDGTIFDVPRGMPKASLKTKYAISELIKNGHLVFISSGRSRCIIPEDIVELNPTGFVTNNGGCALNSEGIIYQENIDDELVELVVDYCNRHDGAYYLETQKYIKTGDLNSKLHVDFINTWGIDFSKIIDGDYKNDKYQMLMTAFKDSQACFDFKKAMVNKLDTRDQYGFTSFDVSAFGIDKGYGAKKVMEYYEIDSKDAYAFGDGLNDLEMLQAVKESYAVENGHPKLKALAKYIAPDVLDDGFYKIMVQDGLIKPMEE